MRERDRERRDGLERRRQRQPSRVPADNVYALIERMSRRESVAARSDVSRCALCGCPLTADTLTIDHATARALGGEDSPENLQATCVRCNNLKSRLEVAVRDHRERGSIATGTITAVLSAIPDRGERERFASHPSVQALMQAVAVSE